MVGATLGGRGVRLGVEDGSSGARAQGVTPGMAEAGPCSPTPLPPDPPLILHHPGPDFRTSLLKDVRKTGPGGRRWGEGLGAHHSGGLGSGRVWTHLSPQRVQILPKMGHPNFRCR